MIRLVVLLATLPPGRRRVAETLVLSFPWAPAYPDVAARLGLHVGTVHTHLRRIRQHHPAVYAALMAERPRQLAERHRAAVARAEAHSQKWHRRQANRRFYYSHGSWPWERRW